MMAETIRKGQYSPIVVLVSVVVLLGTSSVMISSTQQKTQAYGDRANDSTAVIDENYTIENRTKEEVGCGDGICAGPPEETKYTCPEDCDTCGGGSTYCSPGESYPECPECRCKAEVKAEFTYTPESPKRGEEVTFSAEPTEPSPDVCDELSFDWDGGNGLWGIGKETSHTFTEVTPPPEYPPLPSGEGFIVELNVTNEEEDTFDVYRERVDVDYPETPVAIMDMSPEPPVLEGRSITFDGSDSHDRQTHIIEYSYKVEDSSGDVVKSEEDSGLSESDSIPEVSFTFGTPGDYTAILTVKDTEGYTNTEEIPFHVEVNNDPEIKIDAVAANAPENRYVPGEEITYEVEPTDDEGRVRFINWSFDDDDFDDTGDNEGEFATDGLTYEKTRSYGDPMEGNEGDPSCVWVRATDGVGQESEVKHVCPEIEETRIIWAQVQRGRTCFNNPVHDYCLGWQLQNTQVKIFAARAGQYLIGMTNDAGVTRYLDCPGGDDGTMGKWAPDCTCKPWEGTSCTDALRDKAIAKTYFKNVGSASERSSNAIVKQEKVLQTWETWNVVTSGGESANWWLWAPEHEFTLYKRDGSTSLEEIDSWSFNSDTGTQESRGCPAAYC